MNSLADLWSEVVDTPEPNIFYRLYYDQQGNPLFYSMEDLPGLYIDITLEQFRDSSSNVRVKDGKLITLEYVHVNKLVPHNNGTPCDPTNVAIVVDTTTPNKKWKLNDESN